MTTLTRLAAVGLATALVAPWLVARPTAPVAGGTAGPPRLDVYGDPLPHGALARIGTVRFRHEGRVFAIKFSPDGKTVYSVCQGANTLVRAWSVADGRELRRFGDTRHIGSIDVSPDGRLLAAGEDSNTVRIWSTATGREVRRFVGPPADGLDQPVVPRQQAVRWVRFDPASKTVMAGFAVGGVIIAWDTATGKEIRRWTPAINGWLALSAEAGRVAMSDGHQVRVVEAASGKEIRAVTLSADPNKPGQVFDHALSPDGAILVLSVDDHTLRFYEVATGKELRQAKLPDIGRFLTFSRDGSLLAVAYVVDEQMVFAVIDAATGKELRRMEGVAPGAVTLTFSPDGKTLATDAWAHTIRMWDVATGKRLASSAGHSGAVTTIAVNPDGRHLATCSNHDTAVQLWDAATGAEVRRFDGHAAGVDEVTFSPDGRLLASAAWDHPVLIWEVATGRLVHKLEDHPGLGAYLRFSDDSKTLATGGRGGAIALWNCATGKLTRELTAPPSGLASLLTFQNGRLLAFETADRDDDADSAICLWDITANRLLRRFPGHPGRVNGVILSADGRLLASRGTDKTIRVWEVATGTECVRFQEPGSLSQTGSWTGTQFLAFSPDGRVLVTAATDEPLARRWDLATRKELPPLTGHKSWVGAVDFAANGRILVTGSQDTTALVWEAAAVAPPAATAPVRRTESELAGLWDDLRSPDGGKAHAAIWSLAASRDQAVAYIATRVTPAAVVDDAKIARWIMDLDRNNFTVRERATTALVGVADQAEVALQGALERTRSAEVRERINRILDAAAVTNPTGDRLRDLRSVETLELIATPEAQRLLTSLAGGAPGAYLTRDSRAALTRLSQRSS